VDRAASNLRLYDQRPSLEIACVGDRILWAAGGPATHEVFTKLVRNFREGRADLGRDPAWKNATGALPAETNLTGGASVAESLRIAGLAGRTDFDRHLAKMAAAPVERPGGAGASMVLAESGVSVKVSIPIEAVRHFTVIGFRAAFETAKERGDSGLGGWLKF
jgi:hypothetical protein